MKKTWHTVFLILLICLDAALLLLPLLPGYRALFDIGPHPGRPPACCWCAPCTAAVPY